MSQRDDGIGSPKITPRVSARAAHRNLKAAAAERFGNNRVCASTVDNYARNNGILPLRFREKMSHAPQIALSLFANIADEKQRRRVGKLELLNRRSDGEQRGNA